MDDWTEFERMEQRKAQDERVVQEWARAHGDRDAARHVRNFVAHVRNDIGVNGVITDVKMKPVKDGLEIVACYHMEPDPTDDLPALHPSVTTRSSLQRDAGAAPTTAESTGGACARPRPTSRRHGPRRG